MAAKCNTEKCANIASLELDGYCEECFWQVYRNLQEQNMDWAKIVREGLDRLQAELRKPL